MLRTHRFVRLAVRPPKGFASSLRRETRPQDWTHRVAATARLEKVVHGGNPHRQRGISSLDGSISTGKDHTFPQGNAHRWGRFN